MDPLRYYCERDDHNSDACPVCAVRARVAAEVNCKCDYCQSSKAVRLALHLTFRDTDIMYHSRRKSKEYKNAYRQFLIVTNFLDDDDYEVFMDISNKQEDKTLDCKLEAAMDGRYP